MKPAKLKRHKVHQEEVDAILEVVSSAITVAEPYAFYTLLDQANIIQRIHYLRPRSRRALLRKTDVWMLLDSDERWQTFRNMVWRSLPMDHQIHPFEAPYAAGNTIPKARHRYRTI